jgi:uncharacterized membrane protein YgaE (UPF0421/DUF939 family)
MTIEKIIEYVDSSIRDFKKLSASLDAHLQVLELELQKNQENLSQKFSKLPGVHTSATESMISRIEISELLSDSDKHILPYKKRTLEALRDLLYIANSLETVLLMVHATDEAHAQNKSDLGICARLEKISNVKNEIYLKMEKLKLLRLA